MSWILKVIIILLLFTVGAICIVNAVTYQKVSSVKEDELPADVSKGGALALMWFNIAFAALTIGAGIWMFWAKTVDDTRKEKILNAASEAAYSAYGRAKKSFAAYPRTPPKVTGSSLGVSSMGSKDMIAQRISMLNSQQLAQLNAAIAELERS